MYLMTLYILWHNIYLMTQYVSYGPICMLWHNLYHMAQYVSYDTICILWHNMCLMTQYVSYDTICIVWHNMYHMAQCVSYDAIYTVWHNMYLMAQHVSKNFIFKALQFFLIVRNIFLHWYKINVKINVYCIFTFLKKIPLAVQRTKNLHKTKDSYHKLPCAGGRLHAFSATYPSQSRNCNVLSPSDLPVLC